MVTVVGPTFGFIVWAVGYAGWLYYRIGARAHERQAAMLTPSSVAPVNPTTWPVIVGYEPARA